MKYSNWYYHLLFFVLLFPVQIAVARGAASGLDVYQEHCQHCHGDDGSGEMVDIPNLQIGEGMMQADFMLVETMKRGIGIMPAYDGLLSDDEIDNVITYTRTLQ
ncbi:MAG TPA: cytochrome c [Ectothiorhodospiraceae bacterium]|nr:cytochrome c [Ectothiorhodospiraceae bacterium]